MQLLLASCPVLDPTAAYHSLAYLAAAARTRSGVEVEVRDFNVEWLRYLGEDEVITTSCAWVAERRRALSDKAVLTGTETWEYSRLCALPHLGPGDGRRAFETLRSEDSFYDLTEYRRAIATLDGLLLHASAQCYPMNLDCWQELFADGFDWRRNSDLQDVDYVLARTRPFTDFLDARVVPEMKAKGVDVLGISCTYWGTLVHSLALAAHIRRRCPGIKIVLGGVGITGWWKYLRNKQSASFLFENYVDYLVTGEGETALVELLGRLENGSSVEGVPNLVRYDEGRAAVVAPSRVHYEDLDSLPSPAYDAIDWTQYLSPSSVVLYSPTRGCYWNRCTFCDYGLATDGPTSPWRERSTELVLEDLRQIASAHSFFYLSVDVLSPKGVRKMAQGIVDEGIQIHWAAEFRLEKSYKSDLCELLSESGCVAGSMGLESANQRVIDLIDKGTRVDALPATIKNFREAGIGVQLMAFTGFPSETLEEALDTLHFLEAHKENWAIAGIGQFHLTGQAILAKQPDRFGVTLGRRSDVDVEVCPPFSSETGSRTREEEDTIHSRILQVTKQGMQPGALRGRPFLGGVDTAHTLLYFHRFGPDFFRGLREASAELEQSASLLLSDWRPVSLALEVEDSAFDLIAAAEARREHEEAIRQRYLDGGSATMPWVAKRLADSDEFKRLEHPESFYVFPDDSRTVLRTPFGLRSLIRSMNGRRTLDEVLALYRGDQREAGLGLIRRLVSNGFVTMTPPGLDDTHPTAVGLPGDPGAFIPRGGA
jgi:hypothetical protein